MKLNKEQFRQLILNEVKRIVTQGDAVATTPSVPAKMEIPTVVVSEEVKIEKEIIKEEPKIEIAEVKKLAEEFSRMKELVDFRSPLLRKENQ